MTKEQEQHLIKCFDFHIKHFTNDIKEYQNGLIKTIKEANLKHNTVDKMFVYELVEQGFVFKSKLLIEAIEKEINGKKDLMDQINELLD